MATAGRAQTAVRRILVYGILFALIVVAASGLSGLIERAVAGGSVLTTDDSGLALSLAFTVIGAPLAGLLWWWQRRRFADAAERDSLVWALYLVAMSTTALVAATVGLATAATEGIAGRWEPGAFAAGVVWAGVWVWHRAMRRSSATAPARLPTVPVTIGSVFGLAVMVSGAIWTLSALVTAALAEAEQVLVWSQDWYVPVLQGLVWTAVGAVVWWWHWFREGGRDAGGAFAPVALVIVVGAAAVTTLFAVGTVLFVVLRLLFDSDPVSEALAPLDVAIAAALIGGIVWVYHADVVRTRPPAVRRAARLVVSGVGLIGAASGFGVVVNALLASLSTSLVDDDPRTLLLGGLSALIVGLPVWWLAWQPTRTTSDDEAADRARRVYLVTIFGASAVVAIVTLLLIGFRVFEFALGGVAGSGLVERVRAPLGLLAATAVVFAYHFAVWRRDRQRARTEDRAAAAIGRVVIVAGPRSEELRRGVRAATGAAVTVLHAAEDAGSAKLGDDDLAAVLAALGGLTAPRVLVLGAEGGVQAIPLTDGAARELEVTG